MTKSASGDAKKATAAATSSGVPTRPSGIDRVTAAIADAVEERLAALAKLEQEMGPGGA